MSTAMKISLGVGIALIGIVMLFVGYVISAKFSAEKFEQQVYAMDEQMQNVHGAMMNALQMQGFTVKNYTESDLKKIEIAVQRYADKPQQLMQWAQENGNQLDPSLHIKFMDAIEKFYANWENSQKNKISVSQEYRTFINGTFKGVVASTVFNYPTQKANEIMDRIISSGKTKDAWAAGVFDVEDPFKK